MFKLKQPCDLCPFRKDALPGWLGARRAAEISNGILRQSGVFHCHKTVDYDSEEEEDGSAVATVDKDTQFCAGALWLIEKEEAPNLTVSLAKVVGLYRPVDLKNGEGVVDSETDFINLHANGKHI